MLLLPRVAIGTIEPHDDSRSILWALMNSLRAQGLQVQTFLSRACFARYHGTATASGLAPRHLDSWLMSRDLCRALFVHGAQGSDLAVVQGKFAGGHGEPLDKNGAGGSLDTLCDWLDLPRLVVLDARRIEADGLPKRPEQVDGVLLGRVGDVGGDSVGAYPRHGGRHLDRITEMVQSQWGVAVLGAMEIAPQLRAAVDAVPPGNRPPPQLCQQLGSQFLRHAQPQRVVQLASGRELPWDASPRLAADSAGPELVVALGYDDSMNCYFPDSLDLLEALGATIVDFSPLRDERLPAGTELVYLGCGHPERYAAELAQNDCIKLALRDHLRKGGRIYAEGGGLAYLCQQIEVAPDDWRRMTGIFPAVARLKPSHHQQPPIPVEVTLDCDTWLGRQGARLRGYGNPCWQLEPAGKLCGCVAEADHRYDLVKSCQAIGSRLHLNLAAQLDLLPNFLRPQLPQTEPADPWTVAP